jgi:hypothetical protein
MTYQTKLTSFFQTLPQPQPRPPRAPIIRQTVITDFYGPQAERRRRLAAAKAYRDRYSRVRKFSKNFHQQYPYQQFMGSINCICYCRNEYMFYAVDPTINSTIAELEIDSDHWLERVWVDGGHQRRGIGTNLVRFANQFALHEGGQEYGITVCTSLSENSRYRLTGEGAALVNSCIRRGILRDEQTFDDGPPSPGQY